MNHYPSKAIGILSTLIVLMLSLSACLTDMQPGVNTTPGNDVGVEADVNKPSLNENNTSAFTGFVNGQQGLVTASSLLDYDLTDQNGESMGEIEDLLINMNTGRVRYATIEYGGVLDIGDREVAVPLRALNWNSVGQLGLTIDEQQLATYPDLGADWPNTNDATWNDEVFNFWNDQGIDDGLHDGAIDNTATNATVWASAIVNTGIQDIGFGNGSINDLLIDPQQGHVRYVIVNYGAGVFDNDLVALPLSAFNWSAYQGDELTFANGIDQPVLEQAPTYAADTFNNGFFDSTWDDELANFWQEHGFDMTAMTTGAAGAPSAMTDTTTMSGAVGTTTGMAGVGGIGNAQDIMMRASTLIDYDFQNIDGQVSGEIEDILMDVADGRILFVTLEYGGFLDIGDTELPVPLSAFTWGPSNELVLNFPEEELQNFPDLGTDWPDVNDPAWDDDANGFWRNIGIDPGYDATTASNSIVRASTIVGYSVGDVGYGPGTVRDLIIDLGQNRAKYVILSYGMGVTYDEELVAVPFSAFDASGFGNQLIFAGDLDPTVLDQAPRFDNTLYNDGAPLDATWDDNFDSYWADRGYTVGETAE